MSKIKLIFYSSDLSGIDSELECFANDRNEIYLRLHCIDTGFEGVICLDKPTAIKFSKVVKTEISKLENDGNRV